MEAAVIEIRDATESELRLVRSSWYRSWCLWTRHSQWRNGQRSIAWGKESGRRISECAAHQYLQAFIGSVTDAETVLVAAVQMPDGQSEAVAWACRQPASTKAGSVVLLHFVYTLRDFRRCGIARKLIDRVRTEAATIDAKITPTHMTRAGMALLESSTDDKRNTDPHSITH